MHEGDFDVKNYWLEDNLNIFIDLFKMRSKTLTVSLSSFSKQYEEKKKKDEENQVFKN